MEKIAAVRTDFWSSWESMVATQILAKDPDFCPPKTAGKTTACHQKTKSGNSRKLREYAGQPYRGKLFAGQKAGFFTSVKRPFQQRGPLVS
jgi:hypothetical protein